MMLNSEEIEACNQAKKLADEMANEKKNWMNIIRALMMQQMLN